MLRRLLSLLVIAAAAIPAYGQALEIGEGTGLTIETLKVRADVDEGIALVDVDQTFRNGTDAVQEGTALGRKVKEFLDSGQLVTDALIADVMAERLDRPDAKKGFILDGFPRTLPQVDILDRVMEKLGVSLDRVVMLAAPVDEVVRRLSGRRVCPSCNAVFHVESQPPKSAGVCDNCGSALVQRPDDMEEVIRDRLAVYERQTLPIADVYRERGLLTDMDAIGDPDDVFERVVASLEAA